MKYSKLFRNGFLIIAAILIVAYALFKSVNNTSKTVPISTYYNYDKAVPLKDSVQTIIDTANYKLLSVTYQSIHNKKVTGLLSVPKIDKSKIPVILLIHGLGDHKEVDYVAYGNDFFLKNGYAVLRIDVSEHGDRKAEFYDFDFTGDYKYWSRNIIRQTVFDLRRAIDFLETRKELDKDRIGYYGISLGGIIGTIFCGVENRIKVPVIALAGGQLNLLFEEKAISKEAKDFVGTIEPLNFVKQISPRPLLMLNAKNDEIVPPTMTKLLYHEAGEPKDIIWYDAKHRDAPIDVIYNDGLNWFKKHL
ncbi:alpha/beta fold hydrolase [Aurantibacter sp.]|uniref:alpha/beta hydrolase n=1 Tax=Aurantibacter sp. TaxID=2807103 RepID=UPI003265584A